MNDCPNAEMRDLLPDLLHDRLAANVRAEVTAHVDACADCREELELLRDLNGTLVTYTPRVDVAYIVNALPKPPARAVRPVAPRRTWADWRIAAAVTVLAVGATSVAVVNRGEHAGPPSLEAVAVPVDTQLALTIATPRETTTKSVAVAPNTRPSAPATGPVERTETAGLGLGGHLADLDERQLRSLIDDIEQMKAVPITEPEPVSLRVDPRPAPIPEGR